MAAITPDMIHAAFERSMAVWNKEQTFAEADRELVLSHNFNASSAKDYTRNLHQMLKGKRFTRTLNAEGTRIYLSRIGVEFGHDALNLAIESIEQHIAYYENLSGSRSSRLREIVSEFSSTKPRSSDIIDDFQRQVIASNLLSPDVRAQRLASAPSMPRAIRAITKAYIRNPDVVAEVLFRAEGVCGQCGHFAPFLRKTDDSPFLEIHHKIPLSEGGEDTVENAVALCPNCHREAHYGKNWQAFRP